MPAAVAARKMVMYQNSRMYYTILVLHSLVRWLVLAALFLSITLSYRGWKQHRHFTTADNRLRHWTATISHIQLVLGLTLYFMSPVVEHFLQNFSDALHQRDARFFGMEHGLMMVMAVAAITIGSAKAKRSSTDGGKFKTIAIWFSIGLLIILSSVPWPFSPFTGRPYIRAF